MPVSERGATGTPGYAWNFTPRQLMGVSLTLFALSIAFTIVALLMHDEIVGAKVSYDSNRLHTDESEPLTFNVVHFESGGDFFDPDQPDRLTVPRTGCYHVQAQVTVLGSGYDENGRQGRGNPPSRDFVIAIKRNGNPTDYVAADYLSNELRISAQLNHTGTVQCFAEGDFVQLFVTGNRFVESNWPATGGSVSPVLYMVYVGSAP